MGIMDLVRKISESRKEKSGKFKEMQEQDRLENMLIERKKSSNRRELEKYYKDQEEKQVKEALDKIHKKRNKDSWKSDNSLLKSQTSILKTDKSALASGKSILKQKNIFLDHKSNNPIDKKNMFTKW